MYSLIMDICKRILSDLRFFEMTFMSLLFQKRVFSVTIHVLCNIRISISRKTQQLKITNRFLLADSHLEQFYFSPIVCFYPQ